MNANRGARPIPSIIFTVLIVTSLNLSNPLLGQVNKHPGTIDQKLLNKVQKPFPAINVDNLYAPENLNSRFASWAISPKNKLSSINLGPAWKNFKKKSDVVVAVIDTGVDPRHVFLSKNIFVPKGLLSSSNFGVDFSKYRKSILKPFDDHGHGTHVAGIIKSVYPEVKLLVLKYYNPKVSGQDNLKSTINALKYAVDQGVDIINYSGGGPEPAAEELKILRRAEKRGILIIAAAGNEESNIDVKNNAYYPASYGLSNIITVTAHDKNLKMLPSSNFGKITVDVAAPGHRIKSSYPHNRSGYLTGTSQATAFVTGVAGLIKAQFPKMKVAEVIKAIKQAAKKELNLLTKCSTGGRLDAGRAMQLASEIDQKRRNLVNRSLAHKNSKKAAKLGKILYRWESNKKREIQ